MEVEAKRSFKNDFGFWGWFSILFALISFMFAGNLIIDSLNLTVSGFADLRGWDANLLLSYSTIAGIVAIAGCGVLSKCVSRFGVKNIYTICLAIVGVCCMWWGSITQIWEYVLILILVNIFGNGFGFVCGTALLANWFPKKKGLAMGWATIGFQVSALLLLPAFRYLMNRYDLKAAYRMIGICLFALMFVCIFFVRSNPEDRGCPPDNDKSCDMEFYKAMHREALEYAKHSPFSTKRLLRTKQVWQISLINGLVQLAVTALIAQFVPHMVKSGISEDLAVLLYSAASVIGGIGSYLWGVLDYRIGVKRATCWMCIMHAVSGFVFAIIASGIYMATWFIYLSTLLLASILGVSSNYLGSFTASVFGRYDFSNAFSIIYMLVCGIRALSFITVGGLYELTGSYSASYAVTCVLSLVALAITYKTDDTCIGRDR